MLATLKVVRGKEAGREYKLTGEEMLLGRGRECAIVVDDSSASRRHARLIYQNNAHVIEDLDSTNHTFVNGAAITGCRPLGDHDAVRIGETQFVFRLATPVVLPFDEPNGATVLRSLDASPDTEILLEENPAAKLRAILQISRAFGQALDLDVVLDTMLGGLFEIFPQSSRALVLLREGDELIPRAVRHRRDDDGGSVQYSRTIVRRVMDQRQAILSQDAAHDHRFASTQSVMNLHIRSVMCVPLLSQYEREALGVIQLETHDQAAPFKSSDMQILASVAVQVAVFIQHARLHDDILRQSRLKRELELAQLVQQDFLPKAMPRTSDYQFWTYYLAAGKVGGDFYDFLTLPNGNHAVLLGDVSGKGVPAALRMAKASTACKLALLSYPDNVVRAMTAMNWEVCQSARRGGFITFVLCVIDPRSHQLTVVDAGHPSPLLRRMDGSVTELTGPETTGLPLGVVETQVYPTTSVAIEPGDVVVVYSDGISEAANAENKLYSARRVHENVAARKGRSPTATGEALIADVRQHVGQREQTDDICLVVLGRSTGMDW